MKCKKRRIPVIIDMTPMVDITILLLIFYMSSTIFRPQEAKSVTLPESHSKIELPDKNIINITITSDDSVFIDFVVKAEENINGVIREIPKRVVRNILLSDIGQRLIEAREIYPEAFVVLKADRHARFGTLDKIMDSLSYYGTTRFQIITANEAEQGE